MLKVKMEKKGQPSKMSRPTKTQPANKAKNQNTIERGSVKSGLRTQNSKPVLQSNANTKKPPKSIPGFLLYCSDSDADENHSGTTSDVGSSKSKYTNIFSQNREDGTKTVFEPKDTCLNNTEHIVSQMQVVDEKIQIAGIVIPTAGLESPGERTLVRDELIPQVRTPFNKRLVSSTPDPEQRWEAEMIEQQQKMGAVSSQTYQNVNTESQRVHTQRDCYAQIENSAVTGHGYQNVNSHNWKPHGLNEKDSLPQGVTTISSQAHHNASKRSHRSHVHKDSGPKKMSIIASSQFYKSANTPGQRPVSPQMIPERDLVPSDSSIVTVPISNMLQQQRNNFVHQEFCTLQQQIRPENSVKNQLLPHQFISQNQFPQQHIGPHLHQQLQHHKGSKCGATDEIKDPLPQFGIPPLQNEDVCEEIHPITKAEWVEDRSNAPSNRDSLHASHNSNVKSIPVQSYNSVTSYHPSTESVKKDVLVHHIHSSFEKVQRFDGTQISSSTKPSIRSLQSKSNDNSSVSTTSKGPDTVTKTNTARKVVTENDGKQEGSNSRQGKEESSKTLLTHKRGEYGNLTPTDKQIIAVYLPCEEPISQFVSTKQSLKKYELNSNPQEVENFNQSADACDEEVNNVISSYERLAVIDNYSSTEGLEKTVWANNSPASERSNLSQVIELLKSDFLNSKQSSSDISEIAAESSGVDVDGTDKEQPENSLDEYVHKSPIPNIEQSQQIGSSKTKNSNGISESTSESNVQQNEIGCKGNDLSTLDTGIESGVAVSPHAENAESQTLVSVVTVDDNINQNYNNDDDGQHQTLHQSRHNLDYLDRMADPRLRDIACRLAFKATALRDVELRDLIDDMIFHTDAALAHEDTRFQSSQMFFAEENSKLKKRLHNVNHQLETKERQEKLGGNPLGLSNNDVLHLERKMMYLQQEKDRLDTQVTTLLEEKAKWLITQQDLVKTISLKDHKILKLEEKHQAEKMRLHQSLDNATKTSQGVHYKLSVADREIANLEQRAKGKDREIAELRERLRVDWDKMKRCETGLREKDQEMLRLQDMVDTLKVGVDHVLQAYENSSAKQSSTVHQQHGIEALRTMAHSEHYSVLSDSGQSSNEVHHLKHPQWHHYDNRLSKQHQGHGHSKESRQGAHQSRHRERERLHHSWDEGKKKSMEHLSVKMLEEHNQRLPPFNRILWRSLDDGPAEQEPPDDEEPFYSDSEIHINSRSKRRRSNRHDKWRSEEFTNQKKSTGQSGKRLSSDSTRWTERRDKRNYDQRANRILGRDESSYRNRAEADTVYLREIQGRHHNDINVVHETEYLPRQSSHQKDRVERDNTSMDNSRHLSRFDAGGGRSGIEQAPEVRNKIHYDPDNVRHQSRKIHSLHDEIEVVPELETASIDIENEESRYSVTDYFQNYPTSRNGSGVRPRAQDYDAHESGGQETVAYSTLRSQTLSKSSGHHSSNRDRQHTTQSTAMSTLRSASLPKSNENHDTRFDDHLNSFHDHDPSLSGSHSQSHDPQTCFMTLSSDSSSQVFNQHYGPLSSRSASRNGDHEHHNDQSEKGLHCRPLPLSPPIEPQQQIELSTGHAVFDDSLNFQSSNGQQRVMFHTKGSLELFNDHPHTISNFELEFVSSPPSIRRNQSSPIHLSEVSTSRRATRGTDISQQDFFQGTTLSASFSTISDQGDPSKNNNNQAINSPEESYFSTGIATLDAKIASLQSKINRTKAVFS